ncbi:THUMP domain-containing protein 1 [Halotydeus destructor]|nr:THUMP domain-containing protein 1 [Halotydeus destructor]
MSNKDDAKGSKRKKNYYSDYSKRQAVRHQLQAGQKGFLISCNNRERECVNESYDVLNEYIDKIYPAKVKSEDNVDVEAEIANEIKGIKQKARLQQCLSRAKNIVFIQCPDLVDPCKIVQSLLEDIEESKIQKTRYAIRMIPVSITFEATIEFIEKGLEELIEKIKENLPQETTFVVQAKVRNNNNITRSGIIEACAPVVKKCLPDWKVNFDNPNMTLNLDVLVKVCCASFLPDFARFKKYNLIELAGTVEKQEGVAGKDGTSVKIEDNA